jgi:prolipoprotein diacylglyceryltransferase
MTPETFVLTLALLLAAVFTWAFRVLPRERWQILASVPLRPAENGGWQGLNLTYYGLLSATAYALGLAVYLVLARALALPLGRALLLVALILAFSAPAARLVARVVERNAATFTVSGGGFVGILAAPWLVLTVTDAGHVMPLTAAMAVAFVLGEGFGRLACISFGCCYGKPLAGLPAPLRRLFARFGFTFRGKTRKISYASGLEGVPVVPIQALTSVVLTVLSLAGAWLVLRGRPLTALFVTLFGSLVWRIVSEHLRADARGGGRITAYQWFSVISIVYVAALVPFFGGASAVAADLGAGLASLWNPVAILFLQGVWILIFLYTGRSMVTGSQISFHLRGERL